MVYRLLCFVCIMALSVAADRRLNLESYVRSYDSIPIAVIKFTPQDNVEIHEDLPGEVIAGDLEFCGRFRVVRLTVADSAVFASNSIGIYVDGEYMVNSGDIVLDCFVRDATTNEILLGKKYRGTTHSVRGMAHRFANQLYQMLFNEPGIFETKILYVEDRGKNKILSIMPFDGYSTRTIFLGENVGVFPSFLDSNTIVWTSFQRGKPDIYKGSLYDGRMVPLIVSRFVDTSPVGCLVIGRIAYASSRHGSLDIYTCEYNGNDQKQLTFSKSIDTSPCWSPTGGQIAFISDRTTRPQLYVMDADGQNVRRLTQIGSYQDSPSWSPKGDKIAYCSYQNGKFDIWTINTDGSGAKQITRLAGSNEYPSWSPNGSHISFSNIQKGKSNIFCIRSDGTGLKQITNSGNAKMPDWSKF